MTYPSEAVPPDGAMSRRAALTRVGIGVGALSAVGAAAIAYGSSGASAGTGAAVHDVRAYGAVGDGVTDDTGKIQAAIDAASGIGGVVLFPPGMYLTRRLTLHSRVHLRGSGGDATVLKLHPGARSAVLESDGFERLAGTGSDAGITMFSIRDLTVDGNKSQNETGHGIRIYGYGYEISEVVVFNCRNDGVYSEWGNAGGLPAPSHQMEARLVSVRSHDNERHGIHFNGPHDSMLLNCITFENLGSGFRMAENSSATQLVNCHGWGVRQDLAFDLAGHTLSCLNCYADLAGGVGVRISRSFTRWIGGLVLGANHEGPQREIGIQFVAGPQGEPAGVVVDTKIMNCGTAAVDFGEDRGMSSVRAHLHQPGIGHQTGRSVPGSGLGWIGTPAASTQVEITEALTGTDKNLVIRPAFDLRAQATPAAPAAESVRVFARQVGGRTELCARFPDGSVRVLASGG